MIPVLIQKALAFPRRRRRWILLLAAASLTSYGAYRVYNLPSVTAKRRKIAKFVGALVSVAEAISSSADSVSLVSSDLNRFLLSDSDEIPLSFKQFAKIARSDELSASISGVSEALTIGIVRGMGSASDSQGFADKLLEKLFSNKGSGFASVVVGSFARNMVTAFYSGGEVMDSNCEPSWVNIMCSDSCRELIADSIQRFVGTAVAVYLDKTIEVNTYDELFSGLTNPRHEAQVKDVLVSVCNSAVETLVRTSHEVLTTSNSTSSANIREDASQVCSTRNLHGFNNFTSQEGGGWIEQLSSVLAIPSNKRFVLDVTGRLTFESVKSFLEFLLWKLQDGVKRGVNVVHDEVIMRGLDVVRYLSAKAMLVFSLSFALCLHFAAGPRVLIAA